MAERYVNVDRSTPMLLPADMRDWVSKDDVVHLIIEAVEQVDLSAAKVNQRGSGSAQYPPGMMLALLIYCYSQGVFSSRKIEQASWVNVAVRYVTGDTHPDHDTIAKFRREQSALLQQTFAEVLRIAYELGMARLGTVCLDGTKIKANASTRTNLNDAQLQEVLEAEAEQRIGQAEQADQVSVDEGLPPGLNEAPARRERVRAAREAIARRASEQKRPPRPTDVANTTDPDSRLMRSPKGTIQAYNAQAGACAQTRLISAARVSTANQDRHELVPTLEALAPSAGCPTAVVADCGYDQHEQVVSAEQRWQTQVYIPPQAPLYSGPRQSRTRTAITAERLQRHQRVHSDQGQQLMRQRRTVIEPIFGILKTVMGFERFHLRGHRKVSSEWMLLCTAYNLRTMHRWQQKHRD